MIMVRVISLLMIIGVVMSSPSYCQYDAEEPELKTIGGTVSSISVAKSVIVIQAGNTFTFSVSPQATITRDIYDIKLSDINVGDYVTVEYYDDASGSHIATGISVEYGKGQ